MEDSEEIEYFEDIANNHYSHKVGGYATYHQGASEGYEFVFQINSDEKAWLNTVNSGSIYFYKNIETGHWISYCDFY